MSARALVVVMACIAAIAAAQTACTTSTNTNFFVDSGCSTSTSAQSTFCTCIGLTYNSATNGCTGTYAGDCSTTGLFSTCIASFFNTINVAALGNSFASSCTGISSLRTNILNFQSGSNYTNTVTQTACQAVTCTAANASASSTCLTTIQGASTTTGVSFNDNVCFNPVRVAYALILSGTFNCNATVLSFLLTALLQDLTRVYGYPIILTVYPACGSVTTTYALPVSANAPGVAAATATVQGGGSWLTSTGAVLGVNPSSIAPSATVSSGARAMWTVLSMIAAAMVLAF